MGSGSLAAMAVLESGYKDGLSEEEAVALVNEHQYGNGTAIFTESGGAARRFENDKTVDGRQKMAQVFHKPCLSTQ